MRLHRYGSFASSIRRPRHPNVWLFAVDSRIPHRWTFVLLVFFGTLVYLGGGALYNIQQGNPPSFPHVRFWNNLYALVLDGIHFVSSGGTTAPESAGACLLYTSDAADE